MEVTVISEGIEGSLHPVTAQLLGATSSLGGGITVLLSLIHIDAADE